MDHELILAQLEEDSMVARAGGKASLNPGGEVLLHARNNAFGNVRN